MQTALSEQREAIEIQRAAAEKVERVKLRIDAAISYLDAKEEENTKQNQSAVSVNNRVNLRTFAQKPEENDMIIYTDGTFRQVRPKLYQYRFMLDKVQRSVYGKTKEECYKKRRDYKPKNDKQLSKGSKYSFWLEFWKEKYKKGNIKKNYYDNICRYIRNNINDSIGKMPLNRITSMHLQEFLADIPSENTRVKVAAVLSESLRAAYEARLIPYNPYLGIKIKKAEVRQLGALTHKQQKELLKSVAGDEELRDIITVLLLTGLRQGELLALTRDNVDLKGGKITVKNSYERGTGNFVPPKTKAGYRTVPILGKVMEILEKRTTNRLFEYQNDWLQRRLSKAIKAIGTDYTGHILRHTFISNAYEIEIPPYVVKVIAGHDKIDNAQAYLALRRAEDFIETEIVIYMRGIKALYVKSA